MNIIVSILLTALTVAGGSILWPRLTNQPRPAPLEQVHNIVKDTSLGKSLARVLGVSQTQSVEPVNVTLEASKLTASIMKTAKERTAKIVVTQAVKQVISQIGNLPASQQAQIHELLCSPPPSADGPTP